MWHLDRLPSEQKDAMLRRFDPARNVLDKLGTVPNQEDTVRGNKCAMRLMGALADAWERDPDYVPPQSGKRVEVPKGVFWNIYDYPPHNPFGIDRSGKRLPRDRRQGFCHLHLSVRYNDCLEKCPVNEGGKDTNRFVVKCRDDRRCDPAAFKEIREAAKSCGIRMMYPPNSCRCCKMLDIHCHCRLMCDNCGVEVFEQCQMSGCVQPGKARPNAQSSVRRGYTQAWIMHNKKKLQEWSGARRSCSTINRVFWIVSGVGSLLLALGGWSLGSVVGRFARCCWCCGGDCECKGDRRSRCSDYAYASRFAQARCLDEL